MHSRKKSKTKINHAKLASHGKILRIVRKDSACRGVLLCELVRYSATFSALTDNTLPYSPPHKIVGPILCAERSTMFMGMNSVIFSSLIAYR